MGSDRAAKAYARIGLETGVFAADPHHLIVMLYDGALTAIADADTHLVANRIADKGRAISKAISIIEEGLRGSVDSAQGGPIARQLVELYDYMNRRLLYASLRNDRAALAEVARLLAEVRGAWMDIAIRPATTPPASPSTLRQAAA